MPTSKDIRPHCCSHGYLVVISNIMISASSPLTGLAIGIHNFPEGLATFVATLSSPSLGVALAIAIALHNIPEGVCVAMPVYYATGSKWRGFLWAFLSGISEPFGESPVAECKSKLQLCSTSRNSLVPRPETARRKGPDFHCLRMR